MFCCRVDVVSFVVVRIACCVVSMVSIFFGGGSNCSTHHCGEAVSSVGEGVVFMYVKLLLCRPPRSSHQSPGASLALPCRTDSPP